MSYRLILNKKILELTLLNLFSTLKPIFNALIDFINRPANTVLRDLNFLWNVGSWYSANSSIISYIVEQLTSVNWMTSLILIIWLTSRFKSTVSDIVRLLIFVLFTACTPTSSIECVMYNTVYTTHVHYSSLCLGIKKGLTPLGLSLSVPKLGIFCHVREGIWWRWRELNPRPPALRWRILHA